MSGQPRPPPGGFPGGFPPGPPARPGMGQPGQPQLHPGQRPNFSPNPPGYPNGPLPSGPRPGQPFGGPAPGPRGPPGGFAGPAPGQPGAVAPRGPPGLAGPPGTGHPGPFAGPPGTIARGPTPGMPPGSFGRGSPSPPPPGPGQQGVRGPPAGLPSQIPGGRPGTPGGTPTQPGYSAPGQYQQPPPPGIHPTASRPGTAPGSTSYQQQQHPGAGPPSALGGAPTRPGFPGAPQAPYGAPPPVGPPGVAPPVAPQVGGYGQQGVPQAAGFVQQPGPPRFGAPPAFGASAGGQAGATVPPTQMMGGMSLSGAPQQQPGPPGAPMYPGAKPMVPPPPGAQQMGAGAAPLAQSRMPPAPFTGQPAGAGASQASRIDPSQIPRPQPQVSTGPLVFETRVNNAANIPPPSTSQFVVRDTGNCSPRMLRSTMTYIPCSHDLLNTSGMPLALVVSPLAAPGPQDTQIQVVDLGDMGLVRCDRCQAYVNPFVRWVDQGRRFICNLCSFTNTTPQNYICNLGPDGRRRDADERPELTHGSVDFVAPSTYMVRDPMPPVFFFLIDVSLNAISTGATASACSAIKQVLQDLTEEGGGMTYGTVGRVKAGIATFNSSIHFYTLNPSQQQSSILIVPDIQDPYTPLPSDLVVPVDQGKERMDEILDLIPRLYADTKVADSCLGAAVSAGFQAIKETGGKLLAFVSVLPSVGVAALAAREAEGRTNSPANEKDASKLLQPQDKTLRTMAQDYADLQVSIDLFVTSAGFCDLASLGVMPRYTGGQLYYYYPFNAQSDAAKLYNDLRWSVLRAQGLEATMKVRCSSGLTVSEYSSGNYNQRIPAEIYIPAIDCDKAILVKIKHEDKLQDNAEACFQCAILYTSTTGQRRVRVHTIALPTTTSLASVFRGADLDSQVTYFLKKAAADLLTHPVQGVREAAIQSCVSILYAYRKFCASASSSGQLILPEALKLLPLYTLALNKSLGMRADAKLDERSYWLSRVRMIPCSLAIPLVYPRLYPLHTAAADHPQKEGETGGQFQLPPSLALSSEKLEAEGVLLLETGEDAIVWLGRHVSPEVLGQLFGVKSIDELVSGPYLLPTLDNALSKRANAIVNTIRLLRSSYLRMRLVKRGDPLEAMFLAYLIEDRAQSGMSYVEFLVYVHRQIQNKMA